MGFEGPLRRMLRSLVPDASIEKISKIRDEWLKRWEREGYSTKLINLALEMADNRARGNTKIVPDKYSDAKNAVLEQEYPIALEYADRWLKSLTK